MLFIFTIDIAWRVVFVFMLSLSIEHGPFLSMFQIHKKIFRCYFKAPTFLIYGGTLSQNGKNVGQKAQESSSPAPFAVLLISLLIATLCCLSKFLRRCTERQATFANPPFQYSSAKSNVAQPLPSSMAKNVPQTGRCRGMSNSLSIGGLSCRCTMCCKMPRFMSNRAVSSNNCK